jgi:hypothetical protein
VPCTQAAYAAITPGMNTLLGPVAPFSRAALRAIEWLRTLHH